MTCRLRWLAICVLSTVMTATAVLAQDASVERPEVPSSSDAAEGWQEPPLQYYGGLRLGVSDDLDDRGEGVSALGIQLGATQVYRYFAIGPELRFSVHIDDHDPYRWTELMLKPAVGFTLDRFALRLYAACPLGIIIAQAFSDHGFEVEPLLGATLFVAKRIALNVELGVGWTHLSGEDGGFLGYSVPRLNLVYGTS